jgi:hypothetical protein
MARKYDIIERLEAKNKRPFIVIGKDKTFEINTEKTNVLGIFAMARDVDEDNPEEQAKLTDKIIKKALGKEAFECIKSMSLTFEAENYIVETIMAGISGTELDEVTQAGK